ncbi:hypothetical protein CATYP_02020 [Corynebacterium atypicum]|uniref:RND efflux pump membrane fusion protein barrel-sandwich domain-containing protein n=1 Tax=Corynebacterium atypicum TaxID=191610 RepID=A0ABM5QLL7_9CORY|nr:efflux RND transporter periplasmic adaptor subunit [Corynebacterium atypicum]AIG63657.1 hypothetical protein CATYP_02020 [Corynebacterium atypicum]
MSKKLPSLKKRTWIIIAILVVLVVIVGGCYAVAFSGKREIPASDVAQVTRQDMESRVAVTGTVEPRDVTNVTTRLPGIINRVHVRAGDPVQEGQVIAEVDTTELERQLSAARTDLANAEQAGANQVQLAQSQASGEEAGQDQQAALASAQASAAASKQSLRNQITNLQNDIYSATLRAPRDGVVVGVGAREGAPAGGPVAVIGDPAQLVLRATVNEADAGKVKNGNEVTFNTPSTGDREFKGTVTHVSSVAGGEASADPGAAAAAAGGSAKPVFSVEIEVNGDTEGLKIGSSARARIRVAHEEQTLVMPREAIYETATGKPSVLVLRPANNEASAENDTAPQADKKADDAKAPLSGDFIVEEQQVTAGLVTDFQVEVTKGIKEGDRVITKASEYHDAVGQLVGIADRVSQASVQSAAGAKG